MIQINLSFPAYTETTPAREIIVAFPDIVAAECDVAVQITHGNLDSKERIQVNFSRILTKFPELLKSKKNTRHGDLTLVVYQSNRADLIGEKIDFSLFFDDSCVVHGIPEPVIDVIDLESDL